MKKVIIFVLDLIFDFFQTNTTQSTVKQNLGH